MKSKLVAALPVLLALAGCSSASATSAPTVTVTAPPVTVTAAPPTTATDVPLALGKTASLADGATVTVYGYKRGVEPRDPNQDAIDVKVCVGSKPASYTGTELPYVSITPWTIVDSQDAQYRFASTTWGTVTPQYPSQQTVRWGDCVRGWVIIGGREGTKMSKARYSTESAVVEWKLQ